MARLKRIDLRRGSTREEQFQWFQSANGEPTQCDSWDIKSELFREAILGLAASGVAVMLGCSRDGAALGVTIYDGEEKHRKWVADSIELEDLLMLIVGRVNARKAGMVRKDVGEGVG